MVNLTAILPLTSGQCQSETANSYFNDYMFC